MRPGRAGSAPSVRVESGQPPGSGGNPGLDDKIEHFDRSAANCPQ
jgi:hypothetical protein